MGLTNYVRVLPDKTLSINFLTGLVKLRGYIERHEIDSFNLRIGTTGSYALDKSYRYFDVELSDYDDILKNVKSLNLLLYKNDLSIISHCPNITHLAMPLRYDKEVLVGYIKNLNKLDSITAPKLSFLQENYGINPHNILISGNATPSDFVVESADELIEIKSQDFENCANVQNLGLCNIAKLHSVSIDMLGLNKLSIIGNYNLKSIDLSDNLNDIRELKVYSNNQDCDLYAEKIVQIIKDNVAGKNKLEKFVFDIKFYPKVTKLLENDLQNSEFLNKFNALVGVGEEINGGFNEISALQMSEFDKKITNIIARCGVSVKDSQFSAFSKMYAFILNETQYANDISERKMKKIKMVYDALKGSSDEQIKLKMVGSGFNASTTVGGFTNDMSLVCAGYSRLLKYMLAKVGIQSDVLQVYMKDDEYDENECKITNHMILKVVLDGKQMIVDPTTDNGLLHNEESDGYLSIINDEYFANYIDNFTECDYYIKKLPSLDNDQRSEIFDEVINQLLSSEKIRNIKTAHIGVETIENVHCLPSNYKNISNHYIEKSVTKRVKNEYGLEK